MLLEWRSLQHARVAGGTVPYTVYAVCMCICHTRSARMRVHMCTRGPPCTTALGTHRACAREAQLIQEGRGHRAGRGERLADAGEVFRRRGRLLPHGAHATHTYTRHMQRGTEGGFATHEGSRARTHTHWLGQARRAARGGSDSHAGCRHAYGDRRGAGVAGLEALQLEAIVCASSLALAAVA